MSLVLVTGGAGFIGSHTVDRLIQLGYKVRILDNLQKPVHLKGKPKYLNNKAESKKHLPVLIVIYSWRCSRQGNFRKGT